MNSIQAAQLAEQQRQLNIALAAQAARDKHTPAPQPLAYVFTPMAAPQQQGGGHILTKKQAAEISAHQRARQEQMLTVNLK